MRSVLPTVFKEGTFRAWVIILSAASCPAAFARTAGVTWRNSRRPGHALLKWATRAWWSGLNLGYRVLRPGCAILITVLLLYALRSMGRNVRTAALWAWCPTVALEVGNDVDVLAVGLAAGALIILARAGRLRHTLLGGVLLGLAMAAKVTPVLVVPAVLRRRWFAVGTAIAGAVAVVYLPHVLVVGSKVLGYIPGYLQENGYSDGQRFALIGLLFSGREATLIAVALLALAGLAVLLFSNPDEPWRGALVMTAATSPPLPRRSCSGTRCCW